jgi:hypothetical protein
MATKGVGRPLTILLQADTTGLAQGLQEAQSGVKKLSKSINKAAQVATVALAGLTAVALDFAKAAAEDQTSALLLEKALQDLTGATDAQVQAVENYIRATSLALGIADDELRPAFARLVRSTDDVAKSQELLNLSLDIAAATGKPLEAVVNAVGRAYDGSTTSLGRLGLGIDKATLASGDFAKIQAEIQSKVGGTASTVAGTATGSFARLTVAVDEAKESIGAGLLPFVGPLADSLARLAPIIAENSELILGIGAVVGALSVAIIALKFALIATNAIMVITTTIGAALKIGYLTLAAATGSATAAQTLAELTYKKSIVALVAYNVAMAGLAVKTAVVTAAQYAFNLALSLNPIGLVVIAVAALAAGFVLAYKKIEPFRDLMDSIFQKIKNIGTAIKESPVGKALTKAFDGFRAAGGPVRQGRSYVVGEAGPELFTANTSGAISPSGSFGGGGGVNITINGAIDPEGVRRSLETLFQNSARRTGPVNFAGARL